MHKKAVMCGEFAEILEAFNFNIKTMKASLIPRLDIVFGTFDNTISTSAVLSP